MQEKVYTVDEVAELLEVERSTVSRWCQRGKFPSAYMRLGVRKFGWRVPESDVIALMETQYRVPAPK
jgi:excisionase family DNA binding protein